MCHSLLARGAEREFEPDYFTLTYPRHSREGGIGMCSTFRKRPIIVAAVAVAAVVVVAAAKQLRITCVTAEASIGLFSPSQRIRTDTRASGD